MRTVFALEGTGSRPTWPLANAKIKNRSSTWSFLTYDGLSTTRLNGWGRLAFFIYAGIDYAAERARGSTIGAGWLGVGSPMTTLGFTPQSTPPLWSGTPMD